MWSDGTPITADDFIYNWQAQSGNPAYTDVGGKPYDAASTAGYNQIQSVVGSNPSGGAACDPGSTADRNVGLCPNGRTVTVTFKPVLRRLAQPLHQHRPGPHRPDGRLEHRLRRPDPDHLGQLVRDPELQREPVGRPGPQPHLLGHAGQADKIVFQFFSDDTQLVPALQNNEVNIINPATVNLSIVQTANQVPNTTKVDRSRASSSSTSTSTRPTRTWPSVQVREAIAHGVNRAAIIARTVGEIARASSRSAAGCSCRPSRSYKGTAYAYSPSQSANAAEGARLHEGLRRVLAPELRAAEGHRT